MILFFFQAEPRCTAHSPPDDLMEKLFLSFSGYECVTLPASNDDTFVNWMEASPYVVNSTTSLPGGLFFDGKRFLQERELVSKSFS